MTELLPSRSLPIQTFVKLGDIDLGYRKPAFQLDHGIRIPIDLALVRPLAKFRRCDDWVMHEIKAMVEFRGADYICGSQTVTVCKARYPGEFYIVSIQTDVDTASEDDLSFAWWHTDKVSELKAVALECYWGEDTEYFDEEFRLAAEEAGRREERDFWNPRAAKPAAHLHVFSDESGMGVRFDGGKPCYFETGERKAHRLLALMADDFPNGKLDAKEAVAELHANTETPWRWAQNLCSKINLRIGSLNLAYQLRCSSTNSLIVWQKTLP